MCRFSVYKGRSIPIGDIILYPNNSLVYQSRDATYHPGVVDIHCFRNIRVNGDGFGIGWYNEDENSPAAGCCLFKLTSPAWSNTNLRNIGQYVCSPVLFAHVRAASRDHSVEEVIISDENCHPFKCGRYTFMHNGFIPNFMKMKRALCMLLSEDTYKGILGSTDSEHIFALFLDMLPNKKIQLSSSVLASTMEAVINKIIELCLCLGIHDAFSCNVAVTDGINIISTRFRNNYEEPPSLYYSYGSEYSVFEGNFKNLDESKASEVLISSAPLAHTDYCPTEFSETTTTLTSTNSFHNDTSSWKLIPRNHILVCVGDLSNITKVIKVKLKPIRINDINNPSTSTSTNNCVNSLSSNTTSSIKSMDTTTNSMSTTVSDHICSLTSVGDSLAIPLEISLAESQSAAAGEDTEPPSSPSSRKGDSCSYRRHSFSNPCLAESSQSSILSPLLTLGQNRMFLWSSASLRK